MATINSITKLGNQLSVNFDDDTQIVCLPTGGSLWLPTLASVPVVVPPASGSIYNPWGAGRGDPPDGWENHASYSAGGYDWSGGALGYGGDIVAPDAGTLHTSGGGNGFEYSAGDMGSAGLRSILYLDTPATRKIARSYTVMNGGGQEAEGPMAAIVIQHQSRFAEAKHYNKGEVIGYVGNSGNNVTHLHVHGLDSAGHRVDFFKFC